jgi:lipoate-protein ligase A
MNATTATTPAGARAWRLLADDGVGAAEGLALDEALMRAYGRDEPPRPPTLRLYSYRSQCALVGRYQRLEAELDLDACARTGTEVSRRPTGGGAIIMGSGQLGVAFVDRAPAELTPKELIDRYAAGVVAGLARLGIAGVLRGKNDIEVSGRKIAGLGVYVDDRGAMLFHASVLADLDVPFMLQVLAIPAAKLAGKAIAGVEERITTVSREAGRRCDAMSLRPVVAAGYADAFGVDLEPGEPEAAESALAKQLAVERYGAPSWLSERTAVPDGSGSAVLRTPAGLLRLYLSTHGELVKSAVIVGDFAELPAAIPALESRLRWQRLEPRTVTREVAASGADAALGVPAERLAEAIVEAGRKAEQFAAAGPVRSTGSCYFPEKETA